MLIVADHLWYVLPITVTPNIPEFSSLLSLSISLSLSLSLSISQKSFFY